MPTAVTDTRQDALAAINATSSAASAAKKDDGSERFLKLLVAQMQNQDPLNPMDNAQVTSQLAQINTVNGIEKLNDTVKSLSSQMLQSQAMQGAALVGRSVLLEGTALHFSEGKAAAGFDLASAADDVKVEVLSPGGRVIDTLDLGAATAGRNGFEWSAPAGSSTDGITFRVAARSGAAAVTATPLTTDLVRSISTNNGDGSLTLQLLYGGNVPYSQIKAVS